MDACNIVLLVFYIVQALLRLAGSAAVYIDKPRAIKLGTLFGGGKIAPGTYRLVVSNSQQLGRKVVLLKRSKQGRVHDLVWTCWFDELSNLVKIGREQSNGDDEQTFYELLFDTSKLLGRCWPSDLRNVANYVPDIGYRLVRRLDKNFDTVLDSGLAVSSMDCMSRLKGNSAGLRSDSVRIQTKLASKVLVDVICLTEYLLTLLYNDIAERRHLDRRWHYLRQRFRTEQLACEVGAWPIC